MTITLKSIMSCDMLGLEEIFRALVWSMHFPRLINMLQHRKKFAKIDDIVLIKSVQKDL
jgi:hypothetical protein